MSMRRTLQKFVCLNLCIVLLLAAFSACGKRVDPLAKSGIQSVTLDQKGRICVEVIVGTRDLEAHKGERLSLFVLAPNETISAIAEKEPLDTQKLRDSLSFRIPLTDGDRTRLYSSFVVAFEDGTALSVAPRYIENPTALAKNTNSFEWSGSPKALSPDDVEAALDLGVMHAVYDLYTSELLGGTDSIVFGGTSYTISESCLSNLDKLVNEAFDAGMQVSLRLNPDLIPAADTAAALLDCLAARYGDRASALIVGASEGFSASHAVLWSRLASLAWHSRTAGARVYVTAPTASVVDSKAFFSDVMTGIDAGGGMDWGAMLCPDIEEGTMLPDDLPEVSDFVMKNSTRGHAARIAVTLPSFSATEPDLQAVRFAYAYRLSLTAGAGLICYPSHMADTDGLCDSTGTPRRAANILATIDTGLSEEDDALCRSFWGDNWSDLRTPSQISRHRLTGVANVGTDGLDRTPLFDFSKGETLGFTGVRTMDPPTVRESASWGKTVLYAWLDPAEASFGGVRKILTDGSALSGASALSIDLLTQAHETETCTATLTLEGTAMGGTRISYASEIVICNRQWQTVTFQIGVFTADLDTSRPCTVTLTVSPDSENEEPYVLWVKGMDARVPDRNAMGISPLVLILIGAAVSFGAFLVLYLLTARRRSARRRT